MDDTDLSNASQDFSMMNMTKSVVDGALDGVVYGVVAGAAVGGAIVAGKALYDWLTD